MSNERRRPDAGRTDPARTTHELINVLAAVQIHLFIARRMFPAPDPADGDLRPPAETATDADAAPRTPAELLVRLEDMVERALRLAAGLDEQVQTTLDPW